MRLTTRGRYGVKAISVIGGCYADKQRISLRDISRQTGRSEGYLEHIISALKTAGLVKSVRGAGGGYALVRPPGEVRLGDILRALEGDLAPADCLTDGDISCGGGDCDCCATRPVLVKLYDSMNEVVDSVTLDTLINNNNKEVIK